MTNNQIGHCSVYSFIVLWFITIPYLTLSGQSVETFAPDTDLVNKLLKKGKYLHYIHPDSAIYYYQLVQNNFEENKSNLDYQNLTDTERTYLVIVIGALNRTGDIYYYDDEYLRAETYYQQSLTIAKNAGLKAFEGEALFDIGYVRYVNNNFSDALLLFKKSHKIYTEIDDARGQFQALNACGLSENHLGNYKSAGDFFGEALEIAETSKDSVKIADIKVHLGILYCEQEQVEEGILLFEAALSYYEKTANNEAISDALINIGVVMKMVGENEKALEYFKESTRIEELAQVKSQLVIRYYNLADLYLQMNEPTKAFEFCQKTMTVANEIASRPFETECNFLMGKYYLLEKDFPEALNYLSKALTSAEESNNKILIANISLWNANAYVQQKNYNKAIPLAKKANTIAQELNLYSIRKEAAYFLFKSYESTNNIKKALKWFEVYHNVSDSVNYYEQQKEIKRIEATYNYNKKEQENELLRNKATLQEQRLKNRTITLFAMILGVALCIVAIVLLINRVRFARALNREQQLLSLQKLEKLNKELDGKERELASKMMFLNQKNELLERIINQLKELQTNKDIPHREINALVNELRADGSQSNWKEFETQFVQVHPDFYKRLYEKHPDLTSYEQRTCAFLRMNLNTKEIASITGRSSKSIEVTRSRIRKKLNLSRKDNLSSFLASI